MLLSREQQLKNLIAMGKEPFLRKFKYGLILLTIGLTIGAIITLHPFAFMGAAFVGIVTFSACQTTPHIHNAVKGFTEGVRLPGEVSFSITRWSDSDTYHATIISGVKPWNFEFIPQGWVPTSGKTEAELVYIDGVEWPVLLLTAQGILHPRYTPAIVNQTENLQ